MTRELQTQRQKPYRHWDLPLVSLALALWFQPINAQAQWLDGSSSWLNTGGTALYTQDNVGIGTASPTRKLELMSDYGGLSFEAGTGSPNSGVIRFGDNTGWKLHFGRSRDSVMGTLNSGTAGVLMTIQDNGNVGIGTVNPTTTLNVVTSLAPYGYTFRGTNSNVGGGNFDVVNFSGASSNAVAGDTLLANNVGNILLSPNATGKDLKLIGGFWTNPVSMTIKDGGNVGIGTTGPVAQYKMTVLGSSPNWPIIGLWNSQTATDRMAQIRFGTNAGTPDVNQQMWGIGMDVDGNGSTNFGITSYYSSGGVGTALTIGRTSGNVGIGGIPSATANLKLQVTGDVSVTGNIAAKYQDVAEWVSASQSMPAGTVVVLDLKRSNEVLPSSSAYDTRVAGVISAQPGLLLGVEGEGKVKVATTGRVKVKVNAANQPIQVGDLLVTSEKEGIAMKSEPMEINGRLFHQPGTIIGKALEPLIAGEGEILVLLSLQ